MHSQTFSYLFLSIVLSLATKQGFAQTVRLADDPDVAAYRPRFKQAASETEKEVVETVPTVMKKRFSKPELDITQRLNQSLDSVYVKNKQIKYAQGYKILVFSGTDKVIMNDIKQKVYRLFPDVELYTVFKQPEYRISFGDFIDKIQAHNYLVKIASSVPEAMVIQDQINIRTKKKQ